MYTIQTEKFGPYTCHRIENAKIGHGFTLVPEIGGTVLDIWMDGRSILDGYETPEELAEAKWGKSAILFPYPNRLLDGRYGWQGITYQFPINNAATGNSIHGYARHHSFEVTEQKAFEESAFITIAQHYDGHLEYYPFPCTLELTFCISNDGVFACDVRVKNLHAEAIPVGFGWHPYFRLTPQVADTALRMPEDSQQVAIDDRMIPTGALTAFPGYEQDVVLADTFIDNAFLAQGRYSVSIQGAGRRITMEADAAVYPYFQVFTPPSRTSVALEPMSCNVNAFNNGNGLVGLPSGHTWGGSFRFKVADEFTVG